MEEAPTCLVTYPVEYFFFFPLHLELLQDNGATCHTLVHASTAAHPAPTGYHRWIPTHAMQLIKFFFLLLSLHIELLQDWCNIAVHASQPAMHKPCCSAPPTWCARPRHHQPTTTPPQHGKPSPCHVMTPPLPTQPHATPTALLNHHASPLCTSPAVTPPQYGT